MNPSEPIIGKPVVQVWCKSLLVLLTLVLLVLPTFGQSTNDVQRATKAVLQLRADSFNPDSFQLRGVWVNKPDKRGQSAICFAYSAQNRMGGYSVAMAILRQNGSLEDLGVSTDEFNFQFFVCREKIRIADITADVVAAINPAMTQPETIQSPADRQKLIDAINASFKQEHVAGYAEIVNDCLIVHSERASIIRFHQAIADKRLADLLKKTGIVTYTLTNDADQRFSYDVKTGKEAK